MIAKFTKQHILHNIDNLRTYIAMCKCFRKYYRRRQVLTITFIFPVAPDWLRSTTKD